MTNPASQQHFSVRNIAPDARLSRWREYLAEIYCRQDVRMHSSDPLSGSISTRHLLDIDVSRFRAGGAQQVIRTKDLVKLDNKEILYFVFPTFGQYKYSQGNRQSCARRGDALILNASREFKIDLSADAESLAIAVPSAAMRRRIANIDDFVNQSKIDDPLFIQMITKLSYSMFPPKQIEEESFLHDVLLSSIASAIATTQGHSREMNKSSDVEIFANIIKIIKLRCGDPTFDLRFLIKASGIGGRRLQQIFRQHDTTFTRELLSQRLSKASRLVLDRDIPIGMISKQCGFSSGEHFSRCYRTRFGITAREHRKTT